MPDELPEGTILVHTHPYKNGDLQEHCIPGRTLIYDSDVGIKDRTPLNNENISQGLILDFHNMIFFTEDENEEPIRLSPCGAITLN